MRIPSLQKTHRVLGLGLSWLMLVWFISGAIMIYAHPPRAYKSVEGRSAGQPVLGPEEVGIDFTRALEASGLEDIPAEARLGRAAGRAAYFFRGREGGYRVVWADTGTRLETVRAELAATAARMAVDRDSELSHLGMVELDQWTVGSGSSEAQRPFHKFAAADGAGTEVYVSARTGEVCQVTTRRERFWSWLGAVPHWLYFTFLRRHLELWRWSIIVLSGLGTILAVSGLWLGLRFFRPGGWGKKGRKSPYRRLRRWHHLLGLAFGLPVLAWTFSGLLSLHPFQWCTPSDPGPELAARLAGELTPPERPALSPGRAVGALMPGFEVKALEVRRFGGRIYYLALDGKGGSRLLPAWETEPRILPSLPAGEVAAAAAGLLPGAGMVRTAWLEKGGMYLPRWKKPLLRAEYNDAGATEIYIDPARGEMVRRLDRSGRLNRWLYNFLHALDLPWLLEHGALRQALMLFLLAGGFLVCLTGPWSWLRRKRR